MMISLKDYEQDTVKKVLNENIKITFKNVNFKYVSSNTNVLNNIDFEVNENDFLGVIGTSGSGKSTILHLLSGLMEPTKGRIIF